MTLSLRRTFAAGLLMAALMLVVPAMASADGDPGSSVLLAQNLYVGGSDGVSAAQQVALSKLLGATESAGAPVRVAIIGQRGDLRQATRYWTRPASAYAEHLAADLAPVYTGRLLVVMPTGIGVYWSARKTAIPSLASSIASVHVAGGGGAELVAATKAAVYKVESAAGISASKLSTLKSAGSSTITVPVASQSASGSAAAVAAGKAASAPAKPAHKLPTGIFAVVVVLILVAYVAYRRGWRPRRGSGDSSAPATAGQEAGSRSRIRITPFALLPTMLLAFVIVALLINQGGGSSHSQPVSNLATNPDIDPGSKLSGTPAPNFTLFDQTGKKISLSQFRGKVVVLSFIDAECQTVCPLTSEAMLDAKRALGRAGKDVQLLGVNANWKSTQVADVLNYTELHGMTGQWDFLTGTPKQLGRIWTDYKINEQPLLSPTTNAIDHVAVTYIIDQRGRMREVYTTQPKYAAIPQFGQLLAQKVASLLPGHPKVSKHYSYAQVKGITPAQTVTVPTATGLKITLGPAHPHLYMFFATWDRQSTDIAAELSQLNVYNRYAAAHKLPSAVAVDEGSVEPSPAALPALLKTVPNPLNYPVAIDQTGKLADGYEVEGEPWFVLTSSTGQIVWYQEGYTSGIPGLNDLERQVKAAFTKAPLVSTNANSVRAALKGSPKPLAQLHSQPSALLGGGTTALYTALAGLAGYPKVINVWASWCIPCQQEFPLFAQASARFGKQVAFLGADNNDHPADARVFLKSHIVWYPSYATTTSQLQRLLPGGLQGTPTTIFVGPTGKVLDVHIGQYQTQGALDSDIEHYALGLSG